MFWKRSVQPAVTGFGNTVAPCIARKSRKTASKNPTYSDRVFVAQKQGFVFQRSVKTMFLKTERAAGGDRVRQHRCPVRSTEIPQNDIKKPDLFGSGFLWRRSRDLCFSGV